MGESESVVAVFLRNGGRVLLEDTEDGLDVPRQPDSEATEEVVDRIVDAFLPSSAGWNLVRIGAEKRTRGGELPIHSVLVDVYTRTLDPNQTDHEWRHASVLTDEGVPGTWKAYRTVAPTLDDILEDCESGSTTLSLEALQLLRDEAAAGTPGNKVREIAERLVEGRKELTALVTRVDRCMNRACQEGRTEAIERIAREELDRAVAADEEAAARAASHCRGNTVLTLSQSGTVQAALTMGEPEQVILLESRPECEAIPVAETLAAEGIDVSLLLDAAAGDVICRRDVDVVLIGADTIDPNGDVRNKVGTRTLAMTARQAGIPVIAATSSDKVAPGPPPDAWVDGNAIYDGPVEIDTECRLFDRTPPELITEIVTDIGTLTPETTIWVAADRRKHRTWRDYPERLQSA